MTSLTEKQPPQIRPQKSPQAEIRAAQDQRLQSDVEAVKERHQWILEKCDRQLDNQRVMAVVAAGKGAEQYLPYTLPNLINQISASAMGLDLFIGLNNGFECPVLIDCLQKIETIQVIHLYLKERFSIDQAAPIYDNSKRTGNEYRLSQTVLPERHHRVFVIHQPASLYAAGKIRMLNDIYQSLILKSIAQGWKPPAYIIRMDAETIFLSLDEYLNEKSPTNGVLSCLDHLKNNPDLDFHSAIERFVLYQTKMIDGLSVMLPALKADVPPLQWFISLTHGNYKGFYWNPGGGTFGKSEVLISLISVIAQRYPGARIEDTHSSIVAYHAGFKRGIFKAAVFTNRVPNSDDIAADNPAMKAWEQQMMRWTAGSLALEENYGKHNVWLMTDSSFPWNVLLFPYSFFKSYFTLEDKNLWRLATRLKDLVIAALAFDDIKAQAIANRDVLQGEQAKASW
ncbi:hypothetical protein PN498_09195 [Oscillatoria sp. CS-180]|nr:hypothetical protein [Oscillatoria sp. CS-180]